MSRFSLIYKVQVSTNTGTDHIYVQVLYYVLAVHKRNEKKYIHTNREKCQICIACLNLSSRRCKVQVPPWSAPLSSKYGHCDTSHLNLPYLVSTSRAGGYF